MKKLFLGLTGNIGSGKTTVLEIFKTKNFSCLNSDEMVHQMFISTHPHYQEINLKINEVFGISFMNKDKIDRQILRQHVHTKENGLKIISNIIKPFITQGIIHAKNENHDTVIEVPLLFESNIENVFYKSILVCCNDTERKRRIQTRNPDYKSQYIDFVMNSQMKQERKIKLADYIVFNENGNSNSLDMQVDSIIQTIKKLTAYKKIS